MAGLSGCVAIGPALMAAKHGPDMLGVGVEPEVEFGNPKNRVADPGALQEINTLATRDRSVVEWFVAAGRFSEVKLTNQPDPVGPESAKKLAEDEGVDAYVSIKALPPASRINALNSKISHGALAMTIYRNDGTIVYKQTANLMQRLGSAESMASDEVIQILLNAFLTDMRTHQPTETRNSLLGNIF